MMIISVYTKISVDCQNWVYFSSLASMKYKSLSPIEIRSIKTYKKRLAKNSDLFPHLCYFSIEVNYFIFLFDFIQFYCAIFLPFLFKCSRREITLLALVPFVHKIHSKCIHVSYSVANVCFHWALSIKIQRTWSFHFISKTKYNSNFKIKAGVGMGNVDKCRVFASFTYSSLDLTTKE